MDKCVDNNFAENGEGNAPHVFSSNTGEIGSTHCMFLQEHDNALYRLREVIIDINMVEYFRLIGADKPAALHPGIGEVFQSFQPEEQHSTYTRHVSALIWYH